MKSYSCSLTTRYKTGYIFSAIIDGTEVVRCVVDAHGYVVQVKSYHAAKIMITKHVTKLGGK